MDEGTELELRRAFSQHTQYHPSKEILEAISELFVTPVDEEWLVDNEEMREMITKYIMPSVMGLWLKKNEDYRGAQMSLGAKIQFVDINRKFWKLKHIVWEEHDPKFEDSFMIMADMVGHLLMLMFLIDPDKWRQVKEKHLRGE